MKSNINRDTSDRFAESIKRFIQSAESSGKQSYHFSVLIAQFKIQRRRIYDFLNVIEATGCCVRSIPETISWLGFDNITATLNSYQIKYKVNQAYLPLSKIVPIEICISLNTLTITLLVCFHALQIKCLDVKELAHFISRDNGRYKTTLCKLYQIIHILEAMGIILKKVKIGEIWIADQYYNPLPLTTTTELVNPFSIDGLINRHIIDTEKVLQQRRSDFIQFAKQSQFQQIPKAIPGPI